MRLRSTYGHVRGELRRSRRNKSEIVTDYNYLNGYNEGKWSQSNVRLEETWDAGEQKETRVKSVTITRHGEIRDGSSSVTLTRQWEPTIDNETLQATRHRHWERGEAVAMWEQGEDDSWQALLINCWRAMRISRIWSQPRCWVGYNKQVKQVQTVGLYLILRRQAPIEFTVHQAMLSLDEV